MKSTWFPYIQTYNMHIDRQMGGQTKKKKHTQTPIQENQ